MRFNTIKLKLNQILTSFYFGTCGGFPALGLRKRALSVGFLIISLALLILRFEVWKESVLLLDSLARTYIFIGINKGDDSVELGCIFSLVIVAFSCSHTGIQILSGNISRPCCAVGVTSFVILGRGINCSCGLNLD